MKRARKSSSVKISAILPSSSSLCAAPQRTLSSPASSTKVNLPCPRTLKVCPGRGAPYTATVLAVDDECRLVVRPCGRTETVALSSGEVHILPAAPATSL